jgi:hypothetical protein
MTHALGNEHLIKMLQGDNPEEAYRTMMKTVWPNWQRRFVMPNPITGESYEMYINEENSSMWMLNTINAYTGMLSGRSSDLEASINNQAEQLMEAARAAGFQITFPDAKKWINAGPEGFVDKDGNRVQVPPEVMAYVEYAFWERQTALQMAAAEKDPDLIILNSLFDLASKAEGLADSETYDLMIGALGVWNESRAARGKPSLLPFLDDTPTNRRFMRDLQAFLRRTDPYVDEGTPGGISLGVAAPADAAPVAPGGGAGGGTTGDVLRLGEQATTVQGAARQADQTTTQLATIALTQKTTVPEMAALLDKWEAEGSPPLTWINQQRIRLGLPVSEGGNE